MSKITSLLSVALVAAALTGGLAGCGSSGGGLVANTPANFHPDGRALPAQTNLSNLRFQISTDKTTYRTGETFSATVTVTNSANAQSTITFPVADKTTWWGYIIAQNGKIVSYEYWPNHNQVFAQVVGTDTYGPNETHQFTYVFPYTPTPDSPPQVSVLPPGTYQIYARLPAKLFDNGNLVENSVPTPVSAPVTITVTN